MCEKSRHLTQDEIDGYWRLIFVKEILQAVENGKTAKLVIFGRVSNKYRLVEIKQKTPGDWEMSISGMIACYTYSYSALVDFIEQLWNKSVTALHLDGEVEFTFNKPIAIQDDETEKE
jgi:hypothetical protein